MPAVSKAQARFMGAVAGGAIKKKGLSPEKAKEFIRGQSMKDLPERAKHYSEHNENTTLTVRGHRAEKDGRISVELGDPPKPVAVGEDYEPSSSATLVMPKEAAAAYPVGSSVVLHCVPSGEEPEAENNATEEAGEGPPPVGRKPIPKSLKMGMLLEKYHAKEE